MAEQAAAGKSAELTRWSPGPPLFRSTVDTLRWTLAVMEPDDSSMTFVAGCLLHALKHNGCLTEKQAVACREIVRRVLKQQERAA